MAIAVNIERLSGLPPTEESPTPRRPTAFQNDLDHREMPRPRSWRTLAPNLDGSKIPDRVKLGANTIAVLRPAETRGARSSLTQELGAAGNIDYNTTHTESTANVMRAEMGEQGWIKSSTTVLPWWASDAPPTTRRRADAPGVSGRSRSPEIRTRSTWPPRWKATSARTSRRPRRRQDVAPPVLGRLAREEDRFRRNSQVVRAHPPPPCDPHPGALEPFTNLLLIRNASG